MQGSKVLGLQWRETLLEEGGDIPPVIRTPFLCGGKLVDHFPMCCWLKEGSGGHKTTCNLCRQDGTKKCVMLL